MAESLPWRKQVMKSFTTQRVKGSDVVLGFYEDA